MNRLDLYKLDKDHTDNMAPIKFTLICIGLFIVWIVAYACGVER